MKNIRRSSFIFIIIALVFLCYKPIINWYYSTKYSEAQSIPFEKQQILSSYDWRFFDSIGAKYNLIANQNKVICISYWKVNDSKSIENFKMLQSIYDEYKTKIEFYFVTDDAQKDVLAFKKTTDFLYPIFYIGSSAPKPLDVKLAPKTYFISKTGRIVYDVSEPVFWNLESVKKTLDELIKK